VTAPPCPPSRYVHGLDGSVRVPARIAAFLVRRAGLSDLRLSMRGLDPELDAALEALVMAAAAWRSGRRSSADHGTELVKRPDVSTDSPLTTADAAQLLAMSARGIRAAILGGRLRATRAGDVWLIDPSDLERYRTSRANSGNGGPE
jgi:excisionase family DNA binding protein